MEKIQVEIQGGNVSDYYYLKDSLKQINVDANINEPKSTCEGLGFGFQELIILLPLAVPVLIELRQMFDSFLKYLSSKNANKQVKIIMVNGDKKLEIYSKNGKLPDIEEYRKFLE